MHINGGGAFGHVESRAVLLRRFPAVTRRVDLRVAYRLHEDLRLVARGQHQQKFNFSEQRAGAGVEWRWRPRTALFGHLLVGRPGNDVLPRADFNAEISYTEGPTQWVAGYRFFDFPSARVSVLSPGLTWWPRETTANLDRQPAPRPAPCPRPPRASHLQQRLA